MRQEIITWDDVNKLIDHLIPQFNVAFDAMIMITRGGLVPGGILAEALNIDSILTASIDFPAEVKMKTQRKRHPFLAVPKFIQFPEDYLLTDFRVLIVDDVWGSGRTITTVRNRVFGVNGYPYTCVLHFNPYRNLFGKVRPDYYAAITDAYIIYPWEIDRGAEKVLPFNYS